MNCAMVMSTCLIIKVEQQWAMLVLEWVTALVHYSSLKALWLALVDGNPFWPCFINFNISNDIHSVRSFKDSITLIIDFKLGYFSKIYMHRHL